MSSGSWSPQQPRIPTQQPASNTSPFLLNVFYSPTSTRQIRKNKSNCARIEIPILYPSSRIDSDDDGHVPELGGPATSQVLGNVETSPMPADSGARGTTAFQVPTSQSSAISSPSSQETPTPSLLTLPLELRLQIYTYLLPPQTHSIKTQYPYNGTYYDSTPLHSTQSLYPPLYFPNASQARPKLTTYSISAREIPIYPEILCVCKQIHDEAEYVLYGDKDVIFDFGVCLDAVLPFLRDRSVGGREGVRNLRVEMDIPDFEVVDSIPNQAVVKSAVSMDLGGKWEDICGVLRDEVKGLRRVDLVFRWCRGLDGAEVGVSIDGGLVMGEGDGIGTNVGSRRLREWEWVREIVGVDVLRGVGVSWWGFEDGMARC